jgi:hypothetical protein
MFNKEWGVILHMIDLACWKSTDVSEEHVAHIFRLEKKFERETSMKQKETRALLFSASAYS